MGKKWSEERKKARSGKGNPMYGVHLSGEKNGFYGKKHTEEKRLKWSHKRTGEGNPNFGNGVKIAGSRNPNWKGGRYGSVYSVDWTRTLRKSIKERDKYTCQICHIQPDMLDIHHRDSNKDSCDPQNLVSLCKSCHSKVTQGVLWI